jgi:hypothetical protein
MLPEDTKKHCAAMVEESLCQSQVDEHFDKAKPEDKLKVYTDEIFKEAAIRWLIETNQVLQLQVQIHMYIRTNHLYDSSFKLLSILLSEI